MIKRVTAVIQFLVIASLVVSLLPGFILSQAGAAVGSAQVDELMSRMSAEDRVGQLFLVSFFGNDTQPTSDIAQLVDDYRIGGVVLLPGNGNFHNDSTAAEQVARLTAGLQRLALNVGQPASGSTDEAGQLGVSQAGSAPRVPLFVAVSHEGDGFPYTSIRDDMTALPSSLAIGATWKTEDATHVGEIAGRELAALGVNLLLGPSLDVLDTPRPASKGDLGVRSFGGNPFWVGRLGQAYISGIHRGSGGRVATVANHFPGLGAADRRPDEEVPTVPKSLSELRNLELVPFVATAGSADPSAVTDGLMASHIRYRGFQGDIRQLTRPISLDTQNLQVLLSEPGLAAWRERGGLIVSDALGVPGLRRYYDPQMQTFPYKRIAQDALLAGNDVLMLCQFGLTDTWTEQFENIKATIQFFRDKYASDTNFKSRVDQSVRRILQVKLRLYGEPDASNVIVSPGRAMDTIGQGRADVLQMARDSMTLIYPTPDELAERLPAAPSPSDSVLIFTDDRSYKECAWCPSHPLMDVNAIETVMLRLYGSKGSGQIDPDRIHSASFAQLKSALLSAPTTQPGDAPGIDTWIAEANWIVFALLDANTDESTSSDALKVFLKLRSDSLRDKQLIAFAFGAPYYLDTTEISKLTAYYGVYSKTEPFVEASVRALFQEYMPGGFLPVSVEGINYDIASQTAPDARQTIQVLLGGQSADRQRPSVDVKVGSTLHLKTGPILDRNGHIVPDGTPVNFRLNYPSESLELPHHGATTVDGVGETSITLERPGQLQITASSNPAVQSTTLVVTVQGEQPATLATLIRSFSSPITSTTGETGTSLSGNEPDDATLVSPDASQGAASVGPTSPDSGASLSGRLKPRVKPMDLWLALLGMVSLNLGADLLRWRRGWTRVFRLRLSLMGLVAGLVGYLAYAVGFLDTGALWRIYGHLGAVLFGVGFSLIPLVSALIGRGIRASE